MDTEPVFVPVAEFDCCECGRHILIIGGLWPDVPMCALCIFFPNWFDDPDARALFDPDGLARPRFSTHPRH